jgi:hypothetical protein
MSPSTLSPQFIDYSTINFENKAPFIEEFGEHQAISDIFLHQLSNDQFLIAFMIMTGKKRNNLEKFISHYLYCFINLLRMVSKTDDKLYT